MEYKRNRKLGRQAVRGRPREQALAKRAHELEPQLRAGTRVRTGETVGTTHVETGHMSASGDRPAVRIVQGGAAVPENFRQNRDYMIRSIGGG